MEVSIANTAQLTTEPRIHQIAPTLPPLEILTIEEYDAQPKDYSCRSTSLNLSDALKRNAAQQVKVLGPKRTIEHLLKLATLSQSAGIPVRFHFDQVQGTQYSVKAIIDETVVLDAPGPFLSKKAAKESIAEAALNALQELHARKDTIKKSASAAGEHNWVGMLYEYCVAIGTQQPRYQEYAVGVLFACELHLSTDLCSTKASFGGVATTKSRNKKLARAAAAFEAVKWLREEGHDIPLPRKSHGEMFIEHSDPAVINVGEASLSNFGHCKDALSISGEEKSHASLRGTKREGGSYIMQVSALCTSLKLPQPVFHLHPDPPDGISSSEDLSFKSDKNSFYSGAAFFPIRSSPPTGTSMTDNGAPSFEYSETGTFDSLCSFPSGPLGTVHHVYGKRNAREQCAKSILKVLREWESQTRRTDSADRFLGSPRITTASNAVA